MNASQGWTTSSYGQGTDTTPMDLATLSEHSAQCMASSGRLVAMQCGAARVLGFVNARLVTTLALLAAIGAVLLVVL